MFTQSSLDVGLVGDAGLLGGLGQVPDPFDVHGERLAAGVVAEAEVDAAEVVLGEGLGLGQAGVVGVQVEAGVQPAEHGAA